MLRRWWNNPQTALRLTLAAICAGGLVAGFGTFLRDIIRGQNDQWTFLLDTAGLLLAVAGALLDFRASARIAEFAPAALKRRSLVLISGGGLVAVSSCVLLGWVTAVDMPALVRGMLSAGITAGIGCGLAGLLYIGWFSGGDLLERRIEQRTDEKW